MKTNNTTIIILLAAAGLGYYLWTKRRKTAAEVGAAAGSAAVTAAANTAGQILTGGTTGTTGSGTSGSGTTTGKYTFTDAELEKNLSKGSTGKNVKALQLFLIKAGKNLPGGADGVFGTNTENALFSYDNVKYTTLKTILPLLYISSIDESKNKIYAKAYGTGIETEVTG